MTTNPVAIVSLIGAFAYFITRLAQTSFYSHFGIEPEDVGLGYADTLNRAGVALLLLLILLAVLTLAVWAVRRLKVPGARGDKIHDLETTNAQSPDGGRGRRISVTGAQVLIVAFVILLVAMPLAYRWNAGRVRNGLPLRPAGVSTPQRLFTNPLGLRVEPVRVAWVASPKTPIQPWGLRGDVSRSRKRHRCFL